MRSATWLLAALACTDAAWADALQATRGQSLREVSHAVEIRLNDGIATYTVRRQFENPGAVADEAGIAIDLPSGAAATGLRIRARRQWFSGELMERDKAAALYHELTGFGAYQPKDPALLQWEWADKLHLQVFPVMPGQVSTVEYTLKVPTRYVRGRYWISYPRTDVGAAVGEDSKPLATPTLVIKPSWGDAQTPITVDGRRVGRDTPVVLSAPPREVWQDAVVADPNASYVASALVVPESSHTKQSIDKLRLHLDITHTFRGDLVVELVTPQGKHVPVHDGAGGTENDLRRSYDLRLPRGTVGSGTWRLVVSDHATLDTGTLDAWSLAFGSGPDATAAAATDTPIFIPDAPETGEDAGVASISIAPPPIDIWTARLGRAAASDAHAFARLEIDVAPQLSEPPVRAQVVFVVDASYSVGTKELEAQLATLRAYAAHVPDAEIEVVAYRRRAARVFDAFVPVAELEEKLRHAIAGGAFALGNGSALEEGAAVAVAALASRPGPRRVVLCTDDLLRSSLAPEQILAKLDPLARDTVVHVVVPTIDDSTSLHRDDGHPLAPLATRHHGILANLHGFSDGNEKALLPVVLELVRPTRIDQLEVSGFSLETATLAEGSGIRTWAAGDSVPSYVSLRGRLWSDPVRRDVSATNEFSTATAAFVFGADQHQELTPDEMMKLALLGRAVSPVTSYVAYEPGTRPSTIGLETGQGFGSGHGALGGSHRTSAPAVRIAPNLAGLLDIEACVVAHQPPSGWRLTLHVETTKDEVVDVSTRSKDAFAACVVETAWAVRLTPSFDRERESFVLNLAAS